MSIAAAHAARTGKSHALFARLAEISKTTRAPKEQAALLGVPAKNIKFIRYHARRAGFDLDAETPGAGRCSRCLRFGPHRCEDAPSCGDYARPLEPRAGKWSPEEDAVLRANYIKLGPPRTAEMLNRGLSSTYMRAERLEIRMRAKWTRKEDRRLMMLWGNVSLLAVAEALGRTQNGCSHRARVLGLKRGIQPGTESLTAAARRTGFCRESLGRILEAYDVAAQPLTSLVTAKPGRVRGAWDPLDVDDAIEKWNATENISAAAAARGMDDETLSRWLEESKRDMPKRPPDRQHWRVPTAVIDDVIADRNSRETVMAAAERLGVDRYALSRWLKSGGVPRGKDHYWRIERAVIDRVVEDRKASDKGGTRCP